MLEQFMQFEIRNSKDIYGGLDHGDNGGIPPDNEK